MVSLVFKCGWLAAWHEVLVIYALVKWMQLIFWHNLYTHTHSLHIKSVLLYINLRIENKLLLETRRVLPLISATVVHVSEFSKVIIDCVQLCQWYITLQCCCNSPSSALSLQTQKCEHACWQHTHVKAGAQKHKCTQKSTSKLTCFLMHAHRCKYSDTL